MPYTKGDVKRIAQMQRDAGWDEEEISNYADMQADIQKSIEEAFSTSKAVSYSDLENVVRQAVGGLLVKQLDRGEKGK